MNREKKVTLNKRLSVLRRRLRAIIYWHDNINVDSKYEEDPLTPYGGRSGSVETPWVWTQG